MQHLKQINLVNPVQRNLSFSNQFADGGAFQRANLSDQKV